MSTITCLKKLFTSTKVFKKFKLRILLKVFLFYLKIILMIINFSPNIMFNFLSYWTCECTATEVDIYLFFLVNLFLKQSQNFILIKFLFSDQNCQAIFKNTIMYCYELMMNEL